MSIRQDVKELTRAIAPPCPTSVYEASDAELIRIAGTDDLARLKEIARGKCVGPAPEPATVAAD